MSVLVFISHGALANKHFSNVLNPAPDIQQVGATVVFEGIVRTDEAGRAIRALAYEAYAPMASNSLAELARDLRSKHGRLALTVEEGNIFDTESLTERHSLPFLGGTFVKIFSTLL